jgi:hypothetical protein
MRRADEAVLLFEANLDDFEDGMGLLRGLYSGERSASDVVEDIWISFECCF